MGVSCVREDWAVSDGTAAGDCYHRPDVGAGGSSERSKQWKRQINLDCASNRALHLLQGTVLIAPLAILASALRHEERCCKLRVTIPVTLVTAQSPISKLFSAK